MAARDQITNPNVEYIVRSREGQNGHNSLFQSPDSIAYREEINRAYEALYAQYGGEIPDDVKAAFYAPIDKRRASAVDGEFMDSVYSTLGLVIWSRAAMMLTVSKPTVSSALPWRRSAGVPAALMASTAVRDRALPKVSVWLSQMKGYSA